MTNESNENNREEDFEFTIEAEFGDLVQVEGYPQQYFIVEGYRCEVSYYPDATHEDLVYELTDAINSDFLEADAVDLTFITDAAQVDEYIRTIDRKNYPKPTAQWLGMLGDWGMGATDLNISKGANEMAKSERKLTARELSAKEADDRKKARKQKAEDIDNLLEIAFWNRQQFEKTGDAAFRDAVIATEEKLAELVVAKEGE